MKTVSDNTRQNCPEYALHESLCRFLREFVQIGLKVRYVRMTEFFAVFQFKVYQMHCVIHLIFFFYSEIMDGPRPKRKPFVAKNPPRVLTAKQRRDNMLRAKLWRAKMSQNPEWRRDQAIRRGVCIHFTMLPWSTFNPPPSVVYNSLHTPYQKCILTTFTSCVLMIIMYTSPALISDILYC